DHTVVIFTSDNGGFINNYNDQKVTSNVPLRSGKGSLYEGGVRVPLIIHWPGITKPGSLSDEPVLTADFYPTILELANLGGDPEHNKSVDGISLAPLLKEPESRLKRDALYWHYPHYYQTTSPVSAIRRGNWKLLEFLEDGHIELYNLETDLGETQNLAPLQPPLANLLQRKLQEWRANVQAPMPRINPDFSQ
ncbi:MAG: sulfatase-like hydrolase/transferase, partial [Verrucomicrobia bacterium]|nr:sulfatase-like hydrolase/transferase [Verrucomicrobiota bacterium]